MVQVWATLLKRSNWISRAQATVNGLGRLFAVLDKLPLGISYALLVGIFLLSLLALVGGALVVSSSPHVPKLLQGLFDNSIWLMLAFVALAVAVHLNGLPRLFLWASRAAGLFWPDLTYHPGWINASRHVRQEDDAVPMSTDQEKCRRVANDVIKAWAIDKVQYDQHRATKPVGFSDDELANFLVIANGIESAIHDLPVGQQVAFGPLYKELGKAGSELYRPETLVACRNQGPSLYSRLREKIPDLPDEPTIDATVTALVKYLVSKYSGRALLLARGWVPIGYYVGLLDRRLRRVPGFVHSQAMRAEVIKLGIEMNVWSGVKPGPFVYPFTEAIARLLLNLGCIRTRPDVKAVPCDDDFIRLNAWAMKRITDEVESVFRNTSDERIVAFCQDRFAVQPQSVARWALAREVDFFLWVQARDAGGGVFGASATSTWQVTDKNLVRS
jgi:hypothetical protein